MAKNISLLGAIFTGVTGVTLPQQGGGTVTFPEVSPTTATESDVASGKIFFKANGNQATGTASGGGSSGLVYETGTYTPTTDIKQPTITFSNTHSTTPIFVGLFDTKGTNTDATNTNYSFMYFDIYRAFGTGIPYNSSSLRYGIYMMTYRGTSTSSVASVTTGHVQYNSDNTGASSSSYSRYFATETGFKPLTNSNRYWRSDRTYKWIAIWK